MADIYIQKASLLIIEGFMIRSEVLDQPVVTIGRVGQANGRPGQPGGQVAADIAFRAPIVSRMHGRFLYMDGRWFYHDDGSTNGTYIDGYHAAGDDRIFPMQNGTILRIDDGGYREEYRRGGVLMYFCEGDLNQRWITQSLDFAEGDTIMLGRDPACRIHLETVTVSRQHGMFYRQDGRLFYRDMNSRNGTILNGRVVTGPVEIHPKDVMIAGNVRLIIADGIIMYTTPDSGGYLQIRGLTRVVNDAEHKGMKKTILNDVNVDISAGKLVAVLGTSGAGKTTFLNCAIGYEEATAGSVMINGSDLYKNKNILKKQMGYVPQEDLLRDGLSLQSTLDYIGRMRLPSDVSKPERQQKIDSVLAMLDLDLSLKKSRIKKLSGGQRKRVSIASELISDPPLLFLDEPTSGLDPETETGLILLLRELAHNEGKTLIVITHTIKNIMQFDMVMFFGPGGKLCYAGSPGQALTEFGVNDFTDIYTMVRTNTDFYAQKCRAMIGGGRL